MDQMTNPATRERDDARERDPKLDKTATDRSVPSRAESAMQYKQKIEELNRARDREIERTLRGI
jgi:hypothetical protein